MTNSDTKEELTLTVSSSANTYWKGVNKDIQKYIANCTLC